MSRFVVNPFRLFMFLIILSSLILSACASFSEPDVDPHLLTDANGQFITVEDVEIYYVTEGNPANPTVILLHGFGASTFSWRLNIQAIADAGYYVIALDRPGFGLSDKSPNIDFSANAQADLIVQMMDLLGIPSATIVGHSQGGSVATYFAVRHPKRLDKLVLVAGAVRPVDMKLSLVEENQGNGPDFGPIALLSMGLDEGALGWLVDTQIFRIVVAGVIGAYFADETRVRDLMASAYGDPALLTEEMVAGYYNPFRTPGWEKGLIAMSLDSENTPLYRADIQAIQHEVLLIWGTADTWVSPAVGDALLHLLPHARMISYEGVGHSPMDVVPNQFNQDLLAFLAN
jgi:pimeloyl-ACP methyl ester carboxylesterase